MNQIELKFTDLVPVRTGLESSFYLEFRFNNKASLDNAYEELREEIRQIYMEDRDWETNL